MLKLTRIFAIYGAHPADVVLFAVTALRRGSTPARALERRSCFEESNFLCSCFGPKTPQDWAL